MTEQRRQIPVETLDPMTFLGDGVLIVGARKPTNSLSDKSTKLGQQTQKTPSGSGDELIDRIVKRTGAPAERIRDQISQIW